jgi:hypothetical protein
LNIYYQQVVQVQDQAELQICGVAAVLAVVKLNLVNLLLNKLIQYQ